MSALWGPARAEGLPALLECTFETGTASSYAEGRFQSRPASVLRLSIGDIDLAAQTASLKIPGEKTAGALRIIRALNANHFLEVANEGFLNLTTVYDRDPKTGAFPAVQSRHFGLFGEAIVSQRLGACREGGAAGGGTSR